MRHFALFMLATALMANRAIGALVLASGFSQSSVTPANFQNSTVLSVALDPLGGVVASNGLNLSTVPFGGGTSQSSALPYVNSHYITESIRYSPSGGLLLLQLNFNGPADVREQSLGGFPQAAVLPSGQGFARSLAIDSQSRIAVTGTNGSVDQPGWVTFFDNTGTQQLSTSVAFAPVAADFDSSDQLYVASFAGQILAIAPDGTPAAITNLPSSFVGPGVGYVESFAIDNFDNWFLGVNLGQRFGANSSAILRLDSDGNTSVLAYGIGDLPIDMIFGPQNELLVATYSPTGSRVVRIEGDFSGQLGLDSPITQAVPEPTSIAIWISAAFLCLCPRNLLRTTFLRRHRLP